MNTYFFQLAAYKWSLHRERSGLRAERIIQNLVKEMRNKTRHLPNVVGGGFGHFFISSMGTPMPKHSGDNEISSNPRSPEARTPRILTIRIL